MELIIVVAIMAILIGVLAPQYIKYVEKSRVAVDDDVANELLTAGCVMASDEDYDSGISMGDRILFSRGGIVISPNNSYISAGLDEYSIGWQNKKVKSKLYGSQTYVVEFQRYAGSTGGFNVTGSWQP